MTLAELLPVWTAVLFTLAIYSFLYKENPWFRFAESVFAGVSIGYGIAFDLRYLRNQWVDTWSVDGTLMILFILAVLVGLLWYCRFSKGLFFAYRWPLAIIVGTGLGMALRTVIFTQFIQQILPQAQSPLWVAGDAMASVNNILMAVMVPCVLLYFWFTGGGAAEGGAMDIVKAIARYTMMAGFGAAFGYTVLTRMSLFIGRSQFLLGITPNPPEAKMAFYAIAAIILITLFGYDLVRRGSE